MPQVSILEYSTMITLLLKGVGVGLVLGLVVAVIIGKFGLFRRKGKVHAVLVKLYYLYIPLICAALFTGWLALSTMQKDIQVLSTALRPAVTELSVSAATAFLEDVLQTNTGEELRVDMLVPLLTAYIDTRILTGMSQLSALAQQLVDPVRSLISEKTARAVEAQLIKLAAGKLSVSEQRLAQLWNEGIITALKAGLVMDIVDVQIENRVNGFWKILKIIAFLLFLPAVLEIGISRYRGV